jgi:hypothetical protein
MKHYIEDLLYAMKLSVYYFAGSFLLGAIIGLILKGFNWTEVIIWGCRVSEILATFGLALSGISFIKRDLMRPLNYQRQWETYFRKFNLSHVIFLISVFIIVFAFTIEYFVTPVGGI